MVKRGGGRKRKQKPGSVITVFVIIAAVSLGIFLLSRPDPEAEPDITEVIQENPEEVQDYRTVSEQYIAAFEALHYTMRIDFTNGYSRSALYNDFSEEYLLIVEVGGEIAQPYYNADNSVFSYSVEEQYTVMYVDSGFEQQFQTSIERIGGSAVAGFTAELIAPNQWLDAVNFHAVLS